MRSQIRILVSGALLAALVLATSAMSAAAVTREPAPLPELIEDDSCGFLVEVTFPVNDEYAITIYDGQGDPWRIIVTGRLVVTFTNPATDETFTANISGPSHIDMVRGTSTQEGPIGGPVGSLPGLNLFSGRADLTTGELRGHLRADVCALLAP